MINAITLQAIEDAKEVYGGKSAARKYVEDKEANPDFIYRVEQSWWDILMADVGWKYKHRAVTLWRAFHPEHFVEDGVWLDEGPDMKYDLDILLSNIAMRRLEHYIESRSDKQLETDQVWNYLTNAKGWQQLEMF